MVSLNGSSRPSSRGFAVLQPRARQQIECVVQSDDVVTVSTHWLGQRLWCGGLNCPACESVPVRDYAYVIATVRHAERFVPILLEVTANEMARCIDETTANKIPFRSGVRLLVGKDKAKSPIRLLVQDDGHATIPGLTSTQITVSAAAKLAGLPAMLEDEPTELYERRIHGRVLSLLQSRLPTA